METLKFLEPKRRDLDYTMFQKAALICFVEKTFRTKFDALEK